MVFYNFYDKRVIFMLKKKKKRCNFYRVLAISYTFKTKNVRLEKGWGSNFHDKDEIEEHLYALSEESSETVKDR